MQTGILEHKHLIIRAEVANPPKDCNMIENWLTNLVSAINMKILMGPYCVYSPMIGNRGMTAAVIIETSHIVLHAWDEINPGMMQLDIYTCSKLEPNKIMGLLDIFDPVKLEYKFLDREHGLSMIEDGNRQYEKEISNGY